MACIIYMYIYKFCIACFCSYYWSSHSCFTLRKIHQRSFNLSYSVIRVSNKLSKCIFYVPKVVSRCHLGAYTHYGKTKLCRAWKYLPCVFYQAHGKELLCRALYIGRTAKTKRTGKIVCRAFFWDARQTLEFAVRFLIAHGKLFSLTFVVPALTPRGNR
jgi:hypothetical protein